MYHNARIYERLSKDSAPWSHVINYSWIHLNGWCRKGIGKEADYLI